MKLPETSSHFRAGFTLIELMLVMSLVLIVTAFTSSIGVTYYQSHVLNETTDNLVSTLRQAQAFAMSGRNNSAFGVYIDGNSYVMFEGQDYESRQSEFDETYTFSSNISLAGPQQIIFSEFTGRPNVVDTLYIALGSREKQITLLPSGYIDK